jgi:catechol 2,3-dioxygenase-like lactoylglutathione lyase family enzyme
MLMAIGESLAGIALQTKGEAMEVNGIAHVFLTASNFERSRAFYRKLLRIVEVVMRGAKRKAIQLSATSLAFCDKDGLLRGVSSNARRFAPIHWLAMMARGIPFRFAENARREDPQHACGATARLAAARCFRHDRGNELRPQRMRPFAGRLG